MTLRKALIFLGVVTAITAFGSSGFFHPDEHCQIVEFTGVKLGLASASHLPWEYGARIRPWLQPFLYFLVTKPLVLAGVRDPFLLTTVMRVATGALSVTALALFARSLVASFPTDDQKRGYAAALPFFGFLPYLAVRTSSETLSAAFLAIALSIVLSPRELTLARFARIGLLLGLAFECRFQTGVLSAGLVLWLAVLGKGRIRGTAIVIASALVVVALSALVDFWGYGAWTLPPLNYVLDQARNSTADKFGTSPFYGYAYLATANIFLPVVAVVVVSMIVAWVRNPKSPITWATLPFVLVHCLIAHKEERFLFPLALVATAFPFLAFPRIGEKSRGFIGGMVRGGSVLSMAILAVYPLGARVHARAESYLFHQFPDGLTVYSLDDEPFRPFAMDSPPMFDLRTIDAPSDLDAPLAEGARPVYLMSNSPAPQLPDDMKATFLFSELPFASHEEVRRAGALWMKGYARLQTRMELPNLAWVTLYKIERR